MLGSRPPATPDRDQLLVLLTPVIPECTTCSPGWTRSVAGWTC